MKELITRKIAASANKTCTCRCVCYCNPDWLSIGSNAAVTTGTMVYVIV